MTDLVDRAFELLRREPRATQDAYAQALIEALGKSHDVYHLDDEDRAAIERSRAQARRGEYVPESVIEAFWRKLGV